MKVLGWVLFIGGVVGMIVLGIACGLSVYQFNRGCADYLKLAGDSSTVEATNGFLGQALTYMETTGKTSGNSSLIFKKPLSDVGIWYKQTKDAKGVLEGIIAKGDEATGTEKSNALLKVRETVLDMGSNGTSVTYPPHIALYPGGSYALAVILWWVLGLATVGGFIIVVVAYRDVWL
jgi:hypothetical protein